MSDMRYFGSYETFRTIDKKEGAVMMGADHLVGMHYSIEFKTDSGKTVAWAKNPFSKEIGFFDDQVTYRLDVMRAREWNLCGVLSLVGITDEDSEENGGYYWGEIALFGYPQKYAQEVEKFINKVSEELIEGKRPDIDLTSSSIDLMLAAKGDWMTTRKATMPKGDGMVVIKKSQSLSEKAIEQGRAGNIGCYVISWLFIIAVIAVIVLIVKTILGW